MSPNNKHIVRKLFKEFLDKGNLAVADEIIAPHHVHHDPATPEAGKGPDGQKKVITLYRNAFSDLHFRMDHMIETDEYVTTRYTSTGTHTGELWGIAPTGKAVNVEGIAVNRILRGQIVETWVIWDALGLMMQLEVVPTLAKAKAQAT